jgi:2'-5' RNA ligase
MALNLVDQDYFDGALAASGFLIRSMNGMAAIRSFVAIELSEEAIVALDRLQRELKKQAPPNAVRWSRPESIHLTLQFLGDVAPERIGAVSEALAGVCVGQVPFVIEMQGLGVFPNPRRPRVVWVGISEPSGALAALQKGVSQVLEPLGFEPEQRPFTPHLTLGRASRRASARELVELGELITHFETGVLSRVMVDRIILMRSDLKPDGAVYTPQAVLALGGSGNRKAGSG